MATTTGKTSLRLEDVIRVTRAAPNSDSWRGHCPHPKHPDKEPSLDIKHGTKQEVLYTCRSKRCDQDEITAALRQLIGTSPATAKAAIPAPTANPKPKKTTKTEGWPGKWNPLTEETYRAICASRSHSYTPALRSLRFFGFREKDGLFGYPVFRQIGDKEPVLIKAAPVALDKKGKRRWFQFAPTTEIPQDSLVCSHLSLSNPNVYKDVLIVEGQWDALYLCELGYAAVGLLSALQRQLSDIEKERLGEAERVFLLPDNEPSHAGHEAMEEIAKLVPWQASPVVVDFPEGIKDMCELRAKLGSDEAVCAELDRLIDGRYSQPKAEAASLDELPHATLRLECLDDIEMEDEKWLWEYRVPLGALTVFNGNPDVGKSTVIADIVARTTTGKSWPDSENEVGPASVLMLVDEDSAAITVKPRLLAAGADLKRVHIVRGVQPANKKQEERMLALDTDVSTVRDAIKQRPSIKLIVFDPLTPYLGKARKKDEQEIRSVLGKLRGLAEETGLAVISLDHFNKDTKMSAIHRNSGTVALVAAPRVVWSFFKDEEKDGERLMLNAKGNTIPEERKNGMRYRIVGKNVPGRTKSVGVLEWLGEAAHSAEQQVSKTAGKRDSAADWIRKKLADGPVMSEEYYIGADAAGHSKNTMERAGKEVRVESWQLPGGGWMKGLPGSKAKAKAAAASQGGHDGFDAEPTF